MRVWEISGLCCSWVHALSSLGDQARPAINAMGKMQQISLWIASGEHCNHTVLMGTNTGKVSWSWSVEAAEVVAPLAESHTPCVWHVRGSFGRGSPQLRVLQLPIILLVKACGLAWTEQDFPTFWAGKHQPVSPILRLGQIIWLRLYTRTGIKLAEVQQLLDPCQNTDHYHFPSTTNDAHGTHACCLSYYDPICVQAAASCWETNFYSSGGWGGEVASETIFNHYPLYWKTCIWMAKFTSCSRSLWDL